MSDVYKLVIDCQGEERIENFILPDGTARELRYFVASEQLVPLTKEELDQRAIDAAIPPRVIPPTPDDAVLAALAALPDTATFKDVKAALVTVLEGL